MTTREIRQDRQSGCAEPLNKGAPPEAIDFLKYLASPEAHKAAAEAGVYVPAIKGAGSSDKDIARITDGKIPQGWQVHHKTPLDDGGTNKAGNLVLIERAVAQGRHQRAERVDQGHGTPATLARWTGRWFQAPCTRRSRRPRVNVLRRGAWR